jgi:hypothetical protein
MSHIRSKLAAKHRFSSEGWAALISSCSATRKPRRPASLASDDPMTKEQARTKPLPGKFPGSATYVSLKGSVSRSRFGTAHTRREDASPIQTDYCTRSC